MTANDVFGLAARQASWLLARQQVIAQNVANSNTPGYKAADLKPFDASLQTASMQLTATSPAHFSIDETQDLSTAASIEGNSEAYVSGNDVSQEQEMGKAGAISRAYALNTAIVKAFNSMVLSAAKG
ncbi:MAG: flagellar basal body protein [Rhodomicrobium sp.]